MFPCYQGSAGISGSKGAIGERGAKVMLSLVVISCHYSNNSPGGRLQDYSTIFTETEVNDR